VCPAVALTCPAPPTNQSKYYEWTIGAGTFHILHRPFGLAHARRNPQCTTPRSFQRKSSARPTPRRSSISTAMTGTSTPRASHCGPLSHYTRLIYDGRQYAIYENGVLARVALFNYITDATGASNYKATITISGGTVPSSVQVK
jgi:hypothetical protein